MTPPESTSLMVELERLRGIVEAGFARLDGRLDVALDRTKRAEEDVRKLREDHDQDVAELRAEHDRGVAELRAEVEELKRARWPLPSLAALVGLSALGLTLYEIAAR